MKQGSIYEQFRRSDKLIKFSDPLGELNTRINIEAFRKRLESAVRKEAKGPGGRPPFDVVLMFKILIVGVMHQLSDDQLELRIYDSYFVQKFLQLDSDDRIPDAKTIWAFRQALTQSGVIDQLFADFDSMLTRSGVTYSKGIIVDAKIIEIPKQRNTREENVKVKNGEVPEEWKTPENENKLRQKDVDARWTTKAKRNYYGYKNHIKIDKKTKLIRSFAVTPASTHDSLAIRSLLDHTDKGKTMYADSGYYGIAVEEACSDNDVTPRVVFRHRRGKKPLTAAQKKRNLSISKPRARVEHVFGAMVNDLKFQKLRSIGLARAHAQLGMLNLITNMKRALVLKDRKLLIGWT